MSIPGLPETDKEVYKLASLDLVKIAESTPLRVDLTDKAKKIIIKFENYFVKAKKRTTIQLMGKDFAEKLNLYRKIFPAGKLPSGKPARVNVKTLENSFRWFFENYDFTWDEIIKATKMYVNYYEDRQYMYMKTSLYFVGKEDKSKIKSSELADYCDMIKDGVKPQDNPFKEKVV